MITQCHPRDSFKYWEQGLQASTAPFFVTVNEYRLHLRAKCCDDSLWRTDRGLSRHEAVLNIAPNQMVCQGPVKPEL